MLGSTHSNHHALPGRLTTVTGEVSETYTTMPGVGRWHFVLGWGLDNSAASSGE